MTDPIIATARGYIGTRFHHQGRLKKTGNHKGGIDCLGLLVCVARELDLRGKNGEALAGFDAEDYPHQPDAEKLYATLREHLCEVTGGRCQAADIVLLNIDGRAQHMGIISPSPVGGGPGWGLACPDNKKLSKDVPLLTSPLQGEGFGIIHAYAPARAVVEHALDDYWRAKITAVFRLPDNF